MKFWIWSGKQESMERLAQGLVSVIARWEQVVRGGES